MFISDLPITPYLPGIAGALKQGCRRLVISAEPGAGKTACVPVAVDSAVSGKTLLLEPRRVAARAAANLLSKQYASPIGGHAGYAVRGEKRLSGSTRIIAATYGVLLRQLISDPALEGVSAVIFDEFHERSLEIDAAFAMVSDLSRVLRDDLSIVVMSATGDLTALRQAMPDARVFEVPGRTFPIEVRHASSTPATPAGITEVTVRQVLAALGESEGDVLAFLPGAGEVNRASALLRDALGDGYAVFPLHGGLSLKEQTAVFEPLDKRKIICSTNVAESSITIDGVRTVIDCGWEKRLIYDKASGFAHLRTVRISLASAIQRSGRAGRTAPGTAYRLWSMAGEAALAPFIPSEISGADLTEIMLLVLVWGTPWRELPWFEMPPEAAVEAAMNQLRWLGAVDEVGKITPRGRDLARYPLPPRVAAMMLEAKQIGAVSRAANIAALLTSDLRQLPGDTADCGTILEYIRRNCARFPLFRETARQLGAAAADGEQSGLDGELIAKAFPERIAQRRSKGKNVYHFAGGGQAELPEGDPLTRYEFLAVAQADYGGNASNGRIRIASPLDADGMRRLTGGETTVETVLHKNPDTGKWICLKQTRFHDLVLNETNSAADETLISRCVVEDLLDRGVALPPEKAKAALRLWRRVCFARRSRPEDFPDWESGAGKRQAILDITSGCCFRDEAAVLKADWAALLKNRLPYRTQKLLDQVCPEFFRTPRGREAAIDYSGEEPALEIRVQELYGVDTHPTVAGMKLRIVLLSPALRPIQITGDLPGFWRGSWELVRKEMKSRYPKHDWREHPEA